MGNKLFQNKYRIPSARALWHNYDGGMYFITICTVTHSLGKIKNNKMYLSEIGKIAEQNLRDITIHYPYAEIPLFVIMPNHVHAIVIINNNSDNCSKDVASYASTTNKTGIINTEKANIRPKDPVMSKKSPKKGTLPVVVRGYKSAVTRYARKYHISFQWQSRYHDHIIRNQSECNRIANYIKNNVINWEKDKYN